MELSDNAVQVIATAAVGVVAVVAVRFASLRVLRRYEARLAQRDPREVASRRTIAALLARVTVAAVAALAVWSLLMLFPATESLARALLASSAVLALVFGLAVAPPLANVGAGILLSFAPAVRLGDRITVGEHTGIVEEITLSYTALVTDDELHVFVPNKDMISMVIVNRSIGGPRRIVTVQLPVSVRAPLEDARRLVLDAASQAESAEGLGLSVRVGDVGEKVVWLTVVGFAPPEADVSSIASDIRERALTALSEADLLPAAA